MRSRRLSVCPLVWPFCKGNVHVLGTHNTQAQAEAKMETLIKGTTTVKVLTGLLWFWDL